MIQCIAECDSDIADPTLMADPANCSTRCSVVEIARTPAKEGHQLRGIQTTGTRRIHWPRPQVWNLGALGKLVPGTDQLTIIAAEDSVTDRSPQILRD